MHYLCPEWWRNDCIYVRLPFSLAEYVSRCLEKVWRQLSQAKEPKILVYHHVPRREVIEYTGTIDDFDFAYAGSTRLDEPVRKYNIKYVIYGHLHSRSKQRIMEVENTLYANAYPLYGDQKGVLLVEYSHHRISLIVH